MAELERTGTFFKLGQQFKHKIESYKSQADFIEMFAQHLVLSYNCSVDQSSSGAMGLPFVIEEIASENEEDEFYYF